MDVAEACAENGTKLYKMTSLGPFIVYVRLRANERNNSQHCCANNAGSCWPTMLRPFARGFTIVGVCGLSTARSPDLEVRGSSLARCVVSLYKELNSTLSLPTLVYKLMGIGDILLGGTLRWISIPSRGGGGVAILLCMLPG